MNVELAEGCETVIDEPYIRVFYDPKRVMRAVVTVDGSGEPVPGADPGSHGYVTLDVNYYDATFGIKILEVMPLSELMEIGEAAFEGGVVLE